MITLLPVAVHRALTRVAVTTSGYTRSEPALLAFKRIGAASIGAPHAPAALCESVIGGALYALLEMRQG